MGWVKPTSFTDPDTQWTNEANAYDGNTATYATEASVPSKSWSSYLELNIAAIECDKVRFYAPYTPTQQTAVTVSVYYSAGWHELYEGIYAHDTWTEKAIGSEETVTAMRFRFYNNHVSDAIDLYLKEADFNQVPIMAASISGTGVLAGTMTSMRYMAAEISGTGTIVATKVKLVNKIWPKFILEIHDSSENLISILENAYDIRWVQELNKAHQLSFSMPIDDSKRADILLTNEIWLRDYRSAEVLRKFILSSTVEQRK